MRTDSEEGYRASDDAAPASRERTKIPIPVQVRVLFREHWICHWCGRPTVFAPALKYLTEFAQTSGYPQPLAYYDLRYRRDAAPMLDHLAAVIDHRIPFARGGAHDETNFVVACNKCNTVKSDRDHEEHASQNRRRRIKARYGEPIHWDGFSALFLILTKDRALTGSEREWRHALAERLALPAP